jgi:hypothetical protein
VDVLAADGESRPVLLQSPPSRVTFQVRLPKQAVLHFGLSAGSAACSPKQGQAVEQSIYVRRVDELSRIYRVFHANPGHGDDPGKPHWIDHAIDLTDFGGQEVEVIFETVEGLPEEAACGSGGWIMPVIIGDDIYGSREG